MTSCRVLSSKGTDKLRCVPRVHCWRIGHDLAIAGRRAIGVDWRVSASCAVLENLALRTGVVVHVRIEGKGLAWQQAVGLVLSIQYRNMRMILRFDSQPRNGPVPYALSAANFSGLRWCVSSTRSSLALVAMISCASRAGVASTSTMTA